jgi:predicted ATPase
LTDADGITFAVGEAVGLSAADTAGQPALAVSDTLDRLRHMLTDRKALIVLDNCEHVIEGAAALAGELLEAPLFLRLLATSREPLRVPGEIVCESLNSRMTTR